MTVFMLGRIYDQANMPGAYRVLVDRLWPRGVSKAEAALNEWCKELAPTPELRMWWNHDPETFAEFSQRYRAELDSNEQLPAIVAKWIKHPKVALLYGARDTTINHAVVLSSYLTEYGSDSH
ncbi:MAG: DUF488 domain-containing protein [Rhodoglobus sp.]